MLNNKRLRWYLDAKIGLFLHWGAYSVAGVEASWPIMAPDLAALMFGEHPRIGEADYVALPARFNPTAFDPGAWVRLAQEAGMQYLILTAKHHDGFCMFDAPGTDYRITNTPYGRDVCAELAKACAVAGMRFGFYYSPPDMHHPGFRNTRRPATQNWLGEPRRREWASYLDYMEAHMRKLLTAYGQVDILWFDGLAGHDKYDPPRFYRLLDELSPSTLINDRLGSRYDFITPEQFIPRRGIPVRQESKASAPDSLFRLVLLALKIPGLRTVLKRQIERYAQGDLDLTQVPVAENPLPGEFQPWETCMTMNRTWAYNPSDASYKPADVLIRNLVEVTSRGGNYLLNIGPAPSGTFPAEAVERLGAIGRWMATNREAIHGATYGPLQNLPFARTTAKQGMVYLHVLGWPDQGEIRIPGLDEIVASVSLLANGESLSFERGGDGRTQDSDLIIRVPRRAPDTPVTVLAIRTH